MPLSVGLELTILSSRSAARHHLYALLQLTRCYLTQRQPLCQLHAVACRFDLHNQPNQPRTRQRPAAAAAAAAAAQSNESSSSAREELERCYLDSSRSYSPKPSAQRPVPSAYLQGDGPLLQGYINHTTQCDTLTEHGAQHAVTMQSPCSHHAVTMQGISWLAVAQCVQWLHAVVFD
jgi:hypothetical protein